MNSAPTPHNQSTAFEQGPPIDLAHFEHAVNAYLDPKIDALRDTQENWQNGNARMPDPKQQLRHSYAEERLSFHQQQGHTPNDAGELARAEAEQRFGIQTQIIELEQMKTSALNGGEAVAPLLHMVGEEMAAKLDKFKALIQEGKRANTAPVGTFTDDERFLKLNESVQTGKLGVAELEKLPESNVKAWLLDTANTKLNHDRQQRDVYTSRGKALSAARSAQAQYQSLNSLLRDGDRMRRWQP